MSEHEKIDKIRSCIIESTHRDDLGEMTADDLFASLDIDSLDQMSIIVEVEAAFDVELEDVEPKDITCIRDYVKLLEKNNDQA